MEQPHARLNKAIAVILFLMTILLSLLSQLPIVLDSGVDKILKLVWILPFAFFLTTSPQLFLSNRLQPFYLFVFCMLIYSFACQMATGNKYFGPDINNFAISLLVTIVSYIFWFQYGGKKIIQALCIVMIFGGTLLAFQVYTGYLKDANIMSATYAYGDKNSVAQILLCCAFFILLFFKSENKSILYLTRFIAVTLLIVMVMTKSRATLVSALYIVYYYAFKYGSKQLKIRFVSFAVLAVIILLLNSSINEIIVQGILMGGRNSSDVNSLSSGRLVLYTIALTKIPLHPWIGSGDYYVDCMPLNILTEFGLIGLSVVLAFITYIFTFLRKRQKADIVHNAAFVIYVSFLLNSIFEAQPPFGPGMKCFILWMLFGFSLAQTRSLNEEKI